MKFIDLCCLKFLLICLSIDCISSRVLLRAKRDDFLARIAEALKQLNEALNAKPVGPNEISPQKPLPNVRKLGFCQTHPSSCDYVSCLAGNFKASGQSRQLRQGADLLLDPELRTAVANDDTVGKMACDKANLTSIGCQNFKALLGALNVVDPKQAHADDEPRDKRDVKSGKKSAEKGQKSPQNSIDYYDTLLQGDKNAKNQKISTTAPLQDCEAIKREVDAKRRPGKFSILP